MSGLVSCSICTTADVEAVAGAVDASLCVFNMCTESPFHDWMIASDEVRSRGLFAGRRLEVERSGLVGAVGVVTGDGVDEVVRASHPELCRSAVVLHRRAVLADDPDLYFPHRQRAGVG